MNVLNYFLIPYCNIIVLFVKRHEFQQTVQCFTIRRDRFATMRLFWFTVYMPLIIVFKNELHVSNNTFQSE